MSLTIKEIKEILAKYRASTKRSIPISIIKELQDKIISRAAEIEGVPEPVSAHMTMEELEEVIREVIRSFKFAQMDPGEAAGVVSAQSIGEPGTQMSLPGDEKVIIRKNGKVHIEEIGCIVDSYLNRESEIQGDSEVYDIPAWELEALAFGPDEKVRWYPISQVSRHLPNGKLLEITTSSGRTIRATFSHSFVLRRDNKVTPVRGSELQVGDRLPLIMRIPVEIEQKYLHVQEIVKNKAVAVCSGNQTSVTYSELPERFELDRDFGYLIGACLSENQENDSFFLREELIPRVQKFTERYNIPLQIEDNVAVIKSKKFTEVFNGLINKNQPGLPNVILGAPDAFVISLFDAVLGSAVREEDKLVIPTKNEDVQDLLALLMLRFGIFTKKSQNCLIVPRKYIGRLSKLVPSVKFDRKEPSKNKMLDVIPGLGGMLQHLSEKLELTAERHLDEIRRDELERLLPLLKREADRRGIDIDKDLDLLWKGVNSDVFWDEIISLKTIDSPTQYVYDFSVPGAQTFCTVEGLITHNTLRTFHFSGVREMNVTLGLPRLIEIIDARKKPSTPIMTIALDEDYIDQKIKEDPSKTRKDIANEIAQRIELTTIYSVAKSIDIDQINLRIAIQLDKELMDDKGITVEDIKKKVEYRRSGLKCVVEEGDRILVEYADEKKSPSLQDLQKLKDKLINISIKGLKDVPRVMIRKKKEQMPDGEERIIYEISSEGSCFTELLRIPGVNPEKTYTNHIHEIADTLGIEAARNAIKREAQEVMEKQSLEVDERHMMLVADIMTHTGEILQIGRHGISGKNASVLARAAFEVTVKHLLDAASQGERDNLVGIIENVIVGQEISLGTGIIDLTISPNYRGFTQMDELKQKAK